MGNGTCTFEGCRGTLKAHALCDAHCWQLRTHGELKPLQIREWPERFWIKVDKTDTCWLWTAARQMHGYGIIYKDGRAQVAHRIAYALEVGPIPESLTLDHLCRVRHCVNPAHLEPVSDRENVARGLSPTAQNARKTHCLRGHEFTDENTYHIKLRSGGLGRTCRACRRKVPVGANA